MRSTSLPLLRPDVRLVYDGAAQDRAWVTDREFEYELTGEGAALLPFVIGNLDGRLNLEMISRKLRTSPDALARVLEPLAHQNLVLDLNAVITSDTSAGFLEALRRECRFWNGAILAQPFWEVLLSGQASTAMLHGWGLEFRHFADAANEYMAAGVAFCRESGGIREQLAKHYVEESGHGDIFLEGLVPCGYSRSQLSHAVPLATTRALINYLWEVAAEGSLPYAATFSLMQAAESSAASAQLFFDELSRLYPHTAALFRAFHRHATIDFCLHHDDSIFEKLCMKHGDISKSERTRTAAVVRELAEHFSAFFEGIRAHYSSGESIRTRRPRSSAFLESCRAQS